MRVFISGYFSCLTCKHMSRQNTDMVLSDEQVEEFRQLYFKRFGKEISKEDAYEQGIKLITMLKLIYKPMPLEEYEAIQKRRLEMLPQIVTHIALHDNDEVV